MDQTWLTSTIDYMYKTVSGENYEGRKISDYQRAFSNGVWVNDLPSNIYEPLASSCLEKRKSTPHGVCVMFGLLKVLYWIEYSRLPIETTYLASLESLFNARSYTIFYFVA